VQFFDGIAALSRPGEPGELLVMLRQMSKAFDGVIAKTKTARAAP